MVQTQIQNRLRKEEQDMKYNEDYKRSYKDETGRTIIYYSKYRYDYKEYVQIKQMAFTILDNKYKKHQAKGLNYNTIYNTLMKMPKAQVLALLDKFQETNKLKQEAKVYQRVKLLDQAEEVANKYFTAVQLKKQNNLIRFIEAIKAGNEKALDYFRSLTTEQQETLINKVDNYIYKTEHKEVEVTTGYIEEL